MINRIVLLAAVALLTVPAAGAQSTGMANPGAARREQATERREAAAARRDAMRDRRAAMTPEQREAVRARRAERVGSMPAEQAQFRTDMRAYQRSLREKAGELRGQVKAGTLTADAMAAELRAFRSANRPTNPAPKKPSPGTP